MCYPEGSACTRVCPQPQRRAVRQVRLVLAPGAYNKAPAWRSRQHWLDLVLPLAIRHGQDVLRRHHISPDTFARVMTAHAQHADGRTGRGCTPTVARIQQLTRASERTVQRARAAARELGIAREVFRGRHLRLAERMQAHQVGSRQRGWASVYALGCPPWLAQHLPAPIRRAVDRGTPPTGRRIRTYPPSSRPNSSAHRAEPRASRARPVKTPSPRRRAHRWNQASWDLAVALQRRIRTFQGVHPGRLAPALSRFASTDKPWSANQLRIAIERVLRLRGWTWLSNPEHPAGYLARLLREIDPHDRPLEDTGAQLRALQAAEADERAGRNLCAHGVGGADQHGRASRCAFCRRSAEV